MPDSWSEFENVVAAYFEIPEGATFWDLLNSPFLVGIVVAVIGWQLNRRFNSAQKRIAYVEQDSATAMRIANEASETADSSEEESIPADVSPSAAGVSSTAGLSSADMAAPVVEDYRDQASEIVKAAKQFVESKIHADSDQRHQKTYAKISGRHPIDRTYALSDREQLNRDQERGLVTLFRVWKRYGSGKGAQNPVPKAVFEQIARDWKLVQQSS